MAITEKISDAENDVARFKRLKTENYDRSVDRVNLMNALEKLRQLKLEAQEKISSRSPLDH